MYLHGLERLKLVGVIMEGRQRERSMGYMR
jgi:hypothetical protein